MRTTVRRTATVGALAVPFALAASGMAFAGESGGHRHGHDWDGAGAVATQDGGLLGLDGDVNPGLNVGGVLGDGPTAQQVVQADQANSGIVQPGGGCTNPGAAFQSKDLVDAALDVTPGVNIGGIGGGPVSQSISQVDRSTSGILQDGSGAGGFASQQGGLLGLDLDVSPAINIGGILFRIDAAVDRAGGLVELRDRAGLSPAGAARDRRDGPGRGCDRPPECSAVGARAAAPPREGPATVGPAHPAFAATQRGTGGSGSPTRARESQRSES
jgi:hypothetical protein